MDLASKIRDIPDFPQPGILFKDITPLLKDPEALEESILQLVDHYQDEEIDLVAGIESRGFIFGTPLAYELGCGFVPIRKPGKLPAEKIAETYELEYGSNTLEMHIDAVQKGQRVLIIDDLLATGGTARAACNLVDQLGGEIVSVAFVVELKFLNGRELLAGRNLFSLIQFD